MSTPWDGHAAAQRGVDRAPVVAPSWYDMAPGAPFVRALLDPALPPTLGHDLLFSYAGGSRRMRMPTTAPSPSRASSSRACSRTLTRCAGFNESHTSILDSVDVAALLNQELAAVAASRSTGLSCAGGLPIAHGVPNGTSFPARACDWPVARAPCRSRSEPSRATARRRPRRGLTAVGQRVDCRKWPEVRGSGVARRAGGFRKRLWAPARRPR